MKITLFVLMGVFCSFILIGQQIVTDDELMQLSLPKGTHKLSQQEYSDFITKRFTKPIIEDFHNHVYQKDNLLIYYSNSSVSSPKFKRSLESSQRIMVGVFKQYSKTIVVDTAKIITVNNIRFGLIRYHENDIWHIRFTSDYDNNLHFFSGFIEYKKPDTAEAEEYLKELLQSMHFRNEDAMGKP